MFRLTIFCLLSFMLAACSLQSHVPAPVETAGSKKKSASSRGSLTSDSYQVKKGDTLYSIAWSAGMDFLELAEINQFNAPYTIYPGQQITLQRSSKGTGRTSTVSTVSSSKVTAHKNENSNKKQQPKGTSSSISPSSGSSKKTLDSRSEGDYAVTKSQQEPVENAKTPDGLPDKVSRWSWPANGRVVGTFSAREQGSKGIKIAGRRGDPIRSAAGGRIVYAGNALRGYGNLVIIKHSEDFLSAYAHLDSILVTEKQQVSAGQTVATMGNTDSQQVVLHFEVRHHGVSVNPLKYLPKQ